MSVTPPNDRVTTRDLILSIDGKIDALDTRLRNVEQAIASESGRQQGRRSALTSLDKLVVGGVALVTLLVNAVAAYAQLGVR